MDDGYALIDAGDGRRLERFGDRVLDRPAPSATGARLDPDAWDAADARFHRPTFAGAPGRWEVRGPNSPWVVELDGLRLELRYGESGQVGLFPEHLALARTVAERATTAHAARESPGAGPRLLNLFAYTGALSILSARAGASVAHVDASRPAVAWARRNAVVSGAAGCPIRWLVDDAERFVAREVSRRRLYDLIALDPPTYGHGPGGRGWRIEDRLGPLLARAREVLDPDAPAAFVLLTAHTPAFGPNALGETLASVFATGVVDSGALALTADSGARLALGAYASWRRR